MLWIGSQLGLMEQLTVTSFLHHGYDVYLWLYAIYEANLPNDVRVMDANTVISFDEIFITNELLSLAQAKEVFAGFSDIFRYKLLHDHGG